MAEGATSFRNQTVDPREMSFGALRRLGIELAQQLAGEYWTDYNDHDPGVTFLEQFCYAITDLAYRVDFDVADHLTEPQGHIDFERLGLELPEHIFPCRPMTAMDYRRVILDRVPEVGNVWVSPAPEDGDAAERGHGGTSALPKGLYRILVRPRPEIAAKDLPRVRSSVQTVFHGFRNLCEDVQEIGFVREIDCSLCAEVEVRRGRPPAELLAEIYHRCAEHISARVRVYPFEQARWGGRRLEDLLSGPPALHGFCDETDLSRGKQAFSVSEFFSIINQIEGVDYIQTLYFAIGDKNEHDAIGMDLSADALRLKIPGSPDEIQVRLFSHGRRLKVPYELFRSSFDGLALKELGAERARQDASKLYTIPVGDYRNLRSYTSIQTQLPSVYGVGRNVLSRSEPPEVRARARQLKGYLLLFDQLMANFASSLANLRDLYSLDVGARATYFAQVLDESQISGVEEIYPPRPDAALTASVGRHDNFEDRKGRLLDYLLALYGEGFRQSSLRTFNVYATAEEKERALIDNKVRFLRAIAELTRDRGSAIDYRDPAGETVSGLQHRVSYLLGFPDHRCRSLTSPLASQGLRPVADDRVLQAPQEVGPMPCDSADFRPPDNPWEDEIPLRPAGDGESLSQLMESAGHLLPRQEDRMAESGLLAGIHLSSYRLGHLVGDSAWQAFLALPGEGRWWRLGTFPNREDAIEAVNRLRRLIVLLNVQSEGMHIIEHILLRSRSEFREEEEGAVPGRDLDFLSFRISVLFPAWTARFRDRRFRQFAKETLCLNCPAHIVPEAFWLEFDDMLELERLQGVWLQSLGGEDTPTGDVEAASARLAEFLLARQGEDCRGLPQSHENEQDPSD